MPISPFFDLDNIIKKVGGKQFFPTLGAAELL